MVFNVQINSIKNRTLNKTKIIVQKYITADQLSFLILKQTFFPACSLYKANKSYLATELMEIEHDMFLLIIFAYVLISHTLWTHQKVICSVYEVRLGISIKPKSWKILVVFVIANFLSSCRLILNSFY